MPCWKICAGSALNGAKARMSADSLRPIIKASEWPVTGRQWINCVRATLFIPATVRERTFKPPPARRMPTMMANRFILERADKIGNRKSEIGNSAGVFACLMAKRLHSWTEIVAHKNSSPEKILAILWCGAGTTCRRISLPVSWTTRRCRLPRLCAARICSSARRGRFCCIAP